ncbi:953_t:CDS:2, partial [Ambispora leptoticha]
MNINLLFRGSRDGLSSANFHRLCDDQGPTVTAIRLKDHSKIIEEKRFNKKISIRKKYEELWSFRPVFGSEPALEIVLCETGYYVHGRKIEYDKYNLLD